MIRAYYHYSTGTIRADLRPDARPAVVHAGPEGRSVVLHLTHREAVHLMDQLRHAVHWAEQTTRSRVFPTCLRDERTGGHPSARTPGDMG